MPLSKCHHTSRRAERNSCRSRLLAARGSSSACAREQTSWLDGNIKNKQRVDHSYSLRKQYSIND